MRSRFISVFAAILLISCSAGNSRADEKPEKIYGGVAGLSGALAHAFIPKDSGLYQKYGLDVELIFFQRTTKQSLGKRLKINDKEILDAAYVAYKKLTEKKPHPTMK